jgi:hypothetical protein
VEYLFFTPYPFPPRPESTLRNNYRNAVGNESCHHIVLKGQYISGELIVNSDVTDLLSTNYPLNVLPLQDEVAWSCPSHCGGLLRIAPLERREKRILDPGTLKKIHDILRNLKYYNFRLQ